MHHTHNLLDKKQKTEFLQKKLEHFTSKYKNKSATP